MNHENQVIDEVLQAREKLLAEHGGNMTALFKYLQESSNARLQSRKTVSGNDEPAILDRSVCEKKAG